jgi:hypothetical protein
LLRCSAKRSGNGICTFCATRWTTCRKADNDCLTELRWIYDR